MAAIRMRAVADEDGELRLRGLPLQKGDEANVFVVTDDSIMTDCDDDDAALLAVLQHDPAWAWLRDEEEDIYSENDVR